MRILNIPSTTTTPEVNFNAATGILIISGRCMPESPSDVLIAAIDWLKEYLNEPHPITTLQLNVEYLNTNSLKILHDFLLLLKKIKTNGNTLHIIWHYQEGDDDIKDEGELYSELLEIPFEFVVQE